MGPHPCPSLTQGDLAGRLVIGSIDGSNLPGPCCGCDAGGVRRIWYDNSHRVFACNIPSLPSPSTLSAQVQIKTSHRTSAFCHAAVPWYIYFCACRCVVVCLCICVRRDVFRDLAMRLSLVVRSYALRVGLRVSGSIPCSSRPSAYPWYPLGT